MKTLIKICGTTSPTDAKLAQEAGADFLGVILEHPASPRSVSLETAREIGAAVSLPLVAVTVNLPLARLLEIHEVLRPHALQLHGDETPELAGELVAHHIRVWAVVAGEKDTIYQRAAQLQNAGADAILVDARDTSQGATIYGGTGHQADWNVAPKLAQIGVRLILAGGLDAQNVDAAIKKVRPVMVDCVSGVEAQKGRKDPQKVRDFVAAVRASDAVLEAK